MRFRIYGASRHDGADKEIELDAASEAEAVKTASTTLLIERVEQVPTLAYQASMKQDRQPAGIPPAQPRPPGYWLINGVGGILFMFGLLFLIGGGFTSGDVFHIDRFDGDYAPGATANAVERMRIESLKERPFEIMTVGGVMIVAGCSMMGLATLFRIEWRIEHAK